jgi:predicted MFS family arabinose efflux permease
MVCMGAMWVLLPAFAGAAGAPSAGAALATVWSVGSLVGGVALAFRRRSTPQRAYPVLLAALAATSVALTVPQTVGQMMAAVALFGLPLAAWLAVSDELVAAAVAPADHGQAFGWVATVGQIGLGAGAAAAGVLTEPGRPASFLLVTAALAAALLVAVAGRPVIAPATGPAGAERPSPAEVPAPARTPRG